MISFKEWLIINDSIFESYKMHNTEEEIRNYISNHEETLSSLFPSDFIDVQDYLTFIYIPSIKKLYTDATLFHYDLIREVKPVLFQAFKDAGMKDQIPEIMSKRRKYFIEGRIVYKYKATDGDSHNYIALYNYPRKESLAPLLSRLKTNGHIDDLFILITPFEKPQLVKDKLNNVKSKKADPILSKISDLMGKLHAGDVVTKQQAFKELENLSKANPENKQIKNILDTVSARMKRLFGTPSFSTTRSEFGPGSGLEKYWGTNKEDLARAKQRLIDQGKIKFNPMTQKYESRLF